MLNAVLLVVSVCILLCIIFYLFYWNRFFAFVFSVIIRILLWNQGESSIWVGVGASSPLCFLVLWVFKRVGHRGNPLLDPRGTHSHQGPPVPHKQPDGPHRQTTVIVEVLDPPTRRRRGPEPCPRYWRSIEPQTPLTARMSGARLHAGPRVAYIQQDRVVRQHCIAVGSGSTCYPCSHPHAW